MNDGRATSMPSDIGEVVRQILLAMGALTHAFGQALADPKTAGLSSNADFVVLTSLYGAQSQRPNELRCQTGLTSGGLSNLFNRLEQQQLLTRDYGRADGDRRGARVSLTPRGRDLIEAAADAIRRTLAEQSALLQHTRDLIDSISDPRSLSSQPAPHRTPIEQIQRYARVGSDLNAAMATDGHDEPTPAKALLVLCAAASTGGTRPRDLLELTDLSSGGVTSLLDRLASAGLIQRTAGLEPDRRAVTVTLTDLGRRDLRDRLERAAHYLPQLRVALTPLDDTAEFTT